MKKLVFAAALFLLSVCVFSAEMTCEEIKKEGVPPILYISRPSDAFLTFSVFVPNLSQPASGVPHMAEHLIFASSREFESGALDLMLESKGYSADAYTSCDFTCFRTVIRPEDLELVCSLFSRARSGPLFDEEELRLEKGIVKDEFYAGRDAGADGLRYRLLNALYGDTIYGLPLEGKDIGAITSEELRQYHKACYRPENYVFAAAGNIDKDLLARTVGRYFKTEGPAPLPEAPALKPAAGVTEISEGGRCGIAAPMATAERLGEAVTCSVLSSLIYNAVRSRLKGSAPYYSHNTGRFASPFVLIVNSPEGKEICRQALAAVKEGRYTDADLEAAKKLQLSDFLTRNQNGKSLTYQLGQMYILHGLEAIGGYSDYISGVSREDIKKAAEKYL
ncbi:MAG: insulinase family protein [Abditibacteriota bacterium]|nr:insulinase family protein [Abditibacteriota bacterium]